MKIKHRSHLKAIAVIFTLLIILAIIAASLFVSHRSAAPENKNSGNSRTTSQKRNVSNAPAFNKTKHSLTDPNSPWVVVNKQHALQPVDFVPPDLANIQVVTVSQKTIPQLRALIDGAKAQNVNLRIVSGYRSYNYQQNLYHSYVAKDGVTEADTYSARPGHSEHQTGLAVDFGGQHGCELELCFGGTPEGRWLNENSHLYGFIIRYTSDNRTYTGYSAEPWHVRYVGVELAGEMKKQKISSLEQFFNVTGGSAYR